MLANWFVLEDGLLYRLVKINDKTEPISQLMVPTILRLKVLKLGHETAFATTGTLCDGTLDTLLFFTVRWQMWHEAQNRRTREKMPGPYELVTIRSNVFLTPR